MPNPSDSSTRRPPLSNPARNATGGTPAAPALEVASEQLFRGATELHINHGGVLYRLRLTSLGKLILTK